MNWQEVIEALEAAPNQSVDEIFELEDVESRPPFIRNADILIDAKQFLFFRDLSAMVTAVKMRNRKEANRLARKLEASLEEIEELRSACEPDVVERPHDPMDYAA